MRSFTLEELAKYNGKHGAPAYIAYNGKVYDASNSFLWKQGEHQVSHMAGEDFTNAFDQAPHGPELLERLPIIGVLVKEP